MMAAWSRPFRENVGNRAGITPVGELLTSGGMLFRGHHVWLGSAINGAGGVGSLLGLPALRLAGFYSLANSEFSTKVFTMPSAPLWLNADAHWTVPSGAPLDKVGPRQAKQDLIFTICCPCCDMLIADQLDKRAKRKAQSGGAPPCSQAMSR